MISQLTIFLFLMTDMTEGDKAIHYVGICFAAMFLIMIVSNVGLSVFLLGYKSYLIGKGSMLKYYLKKWTRPLLGIKMVNQETQEDMDILGPR